MPVYNEKSKKKWTKDGRHYYFKCYYTDFMGNRKQKVSKMYISSTEAKNAERDYLNKVSTKDLTDYNITFEYVYNEWLKFKKSLVKSSTYYSRKNRADLHILPFFKNYKLHSIKANSLNMWKNEILKLNIGLDHKNRIITDMKEILEFSCNNFDFDLKISSKLQKNKTEAVEKESDSKYNFWTFEEFSKFINVVDNKEYYIIFNFFYYTGLRIGEVLALNWNDIDFNKKTLRVNKTLSYKVYDIPYIITSPKTNNSIRLIDLDDNLIKLLLKHKKNEMQLYDFNDNMFVFGNVRPLSPTSFKRYLYKYCELADVKKITPHGFRHSHASLLINLGCDSRDVANRLGDTTVMVEKTYYHIFPNKKSHVINVLNNLK